MCVCVGVTHFKKCLLYLSDNYTTGSQLMLAMERDHEIINIAFLNQMANLIHKWRITGESLRVSDEAILQLIFK